MSARCSSLCLASIIRRQVGTNGGPFCADVSGITFAASILNFVVMTASLSAIQPDVFGVGRMLHGMAERGARRKFCQNAITPWFPWVTVLVMTIALLFAFT